MKSILVLTFFLISGIASSVVAADGPKDILSKIGFSTLEAKAPDFNLHFVDGTEKSLKDFQGKWVLLFFWATWCGICRDEISQIEKIHKEFSGKGLVVLGVSIDKTSPEEMTRFLAENQISFPVSLDLKKHAASLYRAKAVPSLFLVSPAMRIVGMIRGSSALDSPKARDGFSRLLELKQFSAGQDSLVGRSSSRELNLPKALIPPEVTLKGPTSDLYANRAFEIEILVTWPGGPREYLLKTPSITLPPEIEAGEPYAITSSDIDGSVLRYVFPLIAKTTGMFTIGPIELTWAPRASPAEEQRTRTPDMEIRIKRRHQAIYVLGGLFLIGILSIVSVWIYEKRRAHRIREEQASNLAQRRAQEVARLEDIKVRTGGKSYDIALLTHVLAGPLTADEQQKARRLLDEIRYATKGLSPENIAMYEKKIKKPTEEPNSRR